MYAAYLRPNAVNTSLVTGVAWMDTKLLSATALRRHDHPGHGPDLRRHGPHRRRPPLDTLDAAFNSGFRMQDSQGGFYLDGVTAVPLQAGQGLGGHRLVGQRRHRRRGAPRWR